MTQCKIEFTYASHCVSKNMTPRRMLKKCFLIAQMNPQIKVMSDDDYETFKTGIIKHQGSIISTIVVERNQASYEKSSKDNDDKHIIRYMNWETTITN